MARAKRLQLVVSLKEYERLKDYALSPELSMSEVIREEIRSFPYRHLKVAKLHPTSHARGLCLWLL